MSLVAFMHQAAEAGDLNFARHIDEGHAALYVTDAHHAEAYLANWRKLTVPA